MSSESRPGFFRSRPEWQTDLRKDVLEARVAAQGIDARIDAKPHERGIAIIERLREQIEGRVRVSERQLRVCQVSGSQANRPARRLALQFGRCAVASSRWPARA